MKKRILAVLLPVLLVANISSCNFDSKGEIERETKNTDTTETHGEATAGTMSGEYDSATYMWYTLNDDGKSYSACPGMLPDVIKEFVIPGEYKGLPVTRLAGKCLEDSSIETIRISEGIKEILIGFDYCRDIKNIYIPASVVYIQAGAFNCRATMGGHGFIKFNVIEKIVVAEENPCYYVDGNCLIERSSEKIILGCDSSVIPTDGSVKMIGYSAFANCKAIETVILPKSIIAVEYSAFSNCDNLKRVYITSSATEDEKIVNFSPESVLGYDSEDVFHVPDAESLEIYTKIYGHYFKIGSP